MSKVAILKKTSPSGSAILGTDIRVGHDLLQLISSSMYVDPMSIFREYLQNAADSIDEAEAEGVYPAGQRGEVQISIDRAKRQIRIHDNGLGVSQVETVRTLASVGGSKKRGTARRGFRGIGRLAGLGYCRRLLFRTKAAGEMVISELAWDCLQLRALLTNDQAVPLNKAIEALVTLTTLAATESAEHFFEVVLEDVIRLDDDRLLNPERVTQYLAQVVPVPLSTEFKFGGAINAFLAGHQALSDVSIFVNDRDPLVRPYSDVFVWGKDRRSIVSEIKYFEIPSLNDDAVAAIGWIAHHEYPGSFPEACNWRGVRARLANMQIGDEHVLDRAFVEPRFNQWAVGEVHILDRRIVPNGRRDDFEHNAHYANLIAHLAPITREIGKICRARSRARRFKRDVESLERQLHAELELLVNLEDLPTVRNVVYRNAMETYTRVASEMRAGATLFEGHPQTATILSRAEKIFAEFHGAKTRNRRKFVVSDVDLSAIASEVFDANVAPGVARAVVEAILRRIAKAKS